MLAPLSSWEDLGARMFHVRGETVPVKRLLGKDLRANIDAKIDNLRNFICIPVVLLLLAAVLAHFVPGL